MYLFKSIGFIVVPPNFSFTIQLDHRKICFVFFSASPNLEYLLHLKYPFIIPLPSWVLGAMFRKFPISDHLLLVYSLKGSRLHCHFAFFMFLL